MIAVLVIVLLLQIDTMTTAVHKGKHRIRVAHLQLRDSVHYHGEAWWCAGRYGAGEVAESPTSFTSFMKQEIV